MAKKSSRLSLSIFWLSMKFYFLTCLALSRKNIISDVSALLALKSSISLDPHLMLRDWSNSSSSSVCNWVGVTCDLRHGRVRGLHLRNMGIVGTIPPQVGNLSFLVELGLGGNSFHGELPRELFQLQRLRVLNISFNGFGGSIPQSISNLSNLEHLDCTSNFIEGAIPPSIGQLRHLKVWNCGKNTLSGAIPPTIFNLSSLQEITLLANSLSGKIPRDMGNHAQLRVMMLDGNKLSGDIPSAMFNNSKLRYLSLGSNNLSGNLPSNICEGLPKLEYLTLNENDLFGNMLTIWHHCKELIHLDLSSNAFDKGPMPTDLGNLTTLRQLYLSANNLEGEIPLGVLNISSLEELNLNSNYLKGLPHQLCHQPTQLSALGLSMNQLEGSIPSSIGNCTSLEHLFLGNNFLTGMIPMEIGNLNKLEIVALGYNNLNGVIPPKLLNNSKLEYLYLGSNFLSGILPADMGLSLPKLEELHLYKNKFVGRIPNGLSNASMLAIADLAENEFSGMLPNIFGDLTFLEVLYIEGNNLTIGSSYELNFLTSITSCRQLRRLEIVCHTALPAVGASLPKTIANFSESLEHFRVESCALHGAVPLVIGNMSNLLVLSFSNNNLSGPLPATMKMLQKLQSLDLSSNGLQGSSANELCEIRRLEQVSLMNNKLSGAIPACFGNMSSLRILYLGSNRFSSEIPSSFWNLIDILEVDLSSNALVGKLQPQIGTLRAIVQLDLSNNHISSNIPSTLRSLKTLQSLFFNRNKLQGSIPVSLGEMINLEALDLSQNFLSGAIPKSLESLTDLKYVNFSYNRLEGEIPSGGPFENFTAQSFMHNEALCGKPQLLVPPCANQVGKRSRKKLLVMKCILPIVLSIILVVAFIIVLQRKRKNGVNQNERNSSSTLGALRKVSYYELVQATNGFNESNLLGRGSFGSVYHGILSDGLKVAVKVLHLDLENTSKSFEVECNAMRNVRHRNLVKIISSCSNNLDFKSLVMEFMSNGSLEKWLYSDNYCLNFLQRLSIMIDVASALEYLHHGSPMPLVHCDLKPANILLDDDMVAHISDFGIAKLLDEGQSKTHTQTLATLGYVAPEYGSKGTISIKGDVYSYGIMLMEVFTRKKPTDDMFAEGFGLKNWISESTSNSIMEVIDSTLLQHDIHDMLPHMSTILALALNCSADLPEERTTMTNVVASLSKIKALIT